MQRKQRIIALRKTLVSAVALPLVFALAGGAAAQTVVITPQITYLHRNATGDVVARTNEDGSAAVYQADVRPFSDLRVVLDQVGAPGRFLGQNREKTTGPDGGLVRLGARMYAPYSGRFLTPDPLPLTDVALGNPQSFNKYSYALNNPYTFHDASGLKPADGRALYAAGMSAASNAGKQAIKQIIEATAQSLVFRHQVGMNTSGVDRYFESGSSRNLYMDSSYRAPQSVGANRDILYKQFACTEITRTALRIIKNAILDGQQLGTEKVRMINQSRWPFEDHTAILIQLQNGEEYVIDWHATLDVNHPLIQSKSEWCDGKCGTDYHEAYTLPNHKKDIRWDPSPKGVGDPRIPPRTPADVVHGAPSGEREPGTSIRW